MGLDVVAVAAHPARLVLRHVLGSVPIRVDSVRRSLRFHVARGAYRAVNRLAWRFACPPGPAWERALRVDRIHPLWRLNDWLAEGWVDEWLDVQEQR